MVSKELFCSMQDHSLLGHCCTEDMVKKFADEVIKYNLKSLVIHGDNVKLAVDLLEGRAPVGAVCGFPQGANTTITKIREAEDAVRNGAAEVDTVVNFSRMREKKYDYVKDEISGLVKAVKDINPDVVTKFIIYMPYDQNNPLRLTQDEISRIGDFIIEGGGDFIKYHVEHDFIVDRFAAEVKEGSVQLKWSGAPDMAAMVKAIEQGVTRFGHELVPQWLEAEPNYFEV